MTAILAAGYLAGCATLPRVEYRYYPPTSRTLVSVTQTLDCSTSSSDNAPISDEALIVVNSPAVATTYFADLSTEPYRIGIKDIEGVFAWFADSDVAFGFFEDGRLKSINQSSTGQGEAIVKSGVSLVAALAPLGAGPATAKQSACDGLAKLGGGKPITLTYSHEFDAKAMAQAANDDGKPVDLSVTPSGQWLAGELTKLHIQRPKMQVTVTKENTPVGRAAYEGGGEGIVRLPLRKTVNMTVNVRSDGTPIWSGIVTVPVIPASGTRNDTYVLAIPKAALFGKQGFSLVLSEAGAITSVQYTRLTGAAGALNAASTIAGEETQATMARVNDVRAQADLIAQQQRLARCHAQPAKCQ